MIARAPIAAGAIAGRRRRSVAIEADFVVPFAATGLAALDRRAVRAVRADVAKAADNPELAVAVARSVEGLSASDRQRVIRIG